MGIRLLVYCAVLAFIVPGCGRSGHPNPVEPAIPGQSSSVALHPSDAGQSDRHLWGLWQVNIGADHQTVEITPARSMEMHLNVVRLLEVTPCTNCLKIENLQLLPDNVVQADLKLRHPYASGNLKLSGFDVRAIFIGEADYTWPASGRKMAVGDSVPRLLNPDGYTSLFNPTDFPQTQPPALGYIPGNYTFGGDFTATLNPFVAFNKNEPRRVFRFHETSTETIRVRLPDGPIEFGYAIDGCWQTFPEPCVDPVKDFPPDANCLEAYAISTWAGPGLSLDPGAWTYVYATVYDHQGLDTIAEVTAEIPDVMSGAVEMEFYDTRADGGHVFRGKVTNELGVGTGYYPFLVRVADTQPDQNLGEIDAWFLGTLPVRKGWALAWGGVVPYDRAFGTVVNSAGDIYVVGGGNKGTDYDPTPGEEIQDDNRDTYLTKFDWGGGFEWVERWETYAMSDYGDLALDSDGNIYLAGLFRGTVDFDPGPGVAEQTSYYYYLNEDFQWYCDDMFLLKLNPEGEFVWVLTWLGEARIGPKALAIDGASCVYLTGFFEDTQDFDPGDGIDERVICSDSEDAFLLKIGADGTYAWTDTWGGGYAASPVDVVVDHSGDLIVAGGFIGVVDMDPGPGEDWHDSEGLSKTFFTKFNCDGAFQWSRSLSAGVYYGPEYSPVVAVDSSDNIYLGHEFSLVVDFDPGPAMDVRVADGSSDAFLTKYDPDGNYQWVQTWGGKGSDQTDYMMIDASDNIYIGGSYYYTVDFDPGPGVDEHTPTDIQGAFMSKFGPGGVYQWVATWDQGMGHTIAEDQVGNVYLASWFDFWKDPWIDMDPGPTAELLEPESPVNTESAFLVKMPYDFYWW